MIRKLVILISVSLFSCMLYSCGKQSDEAATQKAESEQSSVAEQRENSRADTPALQPVKGDVEAVEGHEDEEEEGQLIVKEAC